MTDQETQAQENATNEAQDPNAITVKSPKTGRSLILSKNLGATLEEATSLFGAERVFGLYQAQAVIRLQAVIRSILDKGGSLEDATKAGLEWRPDVLRKRVGGPRVKVVDPVVEALARHAKGEISKGDLQKIIQDRLAAMKEEAGASASAPAE